MYHTQFLSSPPVRASNGYLQALYPTREQTEYSNICIPTGLLIPCKQKSLWRLEHNIPKESRRIDRCSEFLDVQPSEPRGHTPAPHTLFGFSRSEFLAPASQPKQEMHEMLCCLRKRVNIVSLLLIIGRFLEKPHQRYARYLQCPSADLLLPCQQASAQAWPNWASCHPSSPGLACGRWGCWGVDRHRICSTVTCEVSFPAKRCPTDWQSACIARGACTTCTAQADLSLLLLLLHSNKQGLM